MPTCGMPKVIPSKLSSLTPQIMLEIARIAEATCEFDNCWCETAVQDVYDYLKSIKLAASPYFSGVLDDDREFGGCTIDWSHCHLVLKDGTVIDPTIRQFRDSPCASATQKETVEGWPYLADVNTVAVMPVGDPFIARIGYESHTTGLGWIKRPRWLVTQPSAVRSA